MLICQPIEINKMNKMKNKALVKSKKPRFINQGEMGGGGGTSNTIQSHITVLPPNENSKHMLQRSLTSNPAKKSPRQTTTKLKKH